MNSVTLLGQMQAQVQEASGKVGKSEAACVSLVKALKYVEKYSLVIVRFSSSIAITNSVWFSLPRRK